MHRFVVASEALVAGTLTRRDLRRGFTKVHRNVYVRKGTALSPADRAHAAYLWAGRSGVMVGHSAAALLGSRWLPDDGPAELSRVRRPGTAGIVVHSGAIADDELTTVARIPCTNSARTAYDLGRRLPFETAVIRLDALANATGLEADEVSRLADRYPGARNIRRLRLTLSFVDGGAESPQESRTRLLIVRAGLPRPRTQIPVRDNAGRVVRRIDMGWEQWKVGVEYDGAQHWTDHRQYAQDIERLEFLASQKWRIIRVSAWQLRTQPQLILARIVEALREAGCPI